MSKMSRVAGWIGLFGFILGLVPLLALTFFSPGLRAEGALGIAAFSLGVATLLALIAKAWQTTWFWLLVVIQALLLVGVLVESFSDAALYIGT